jgi:putative transcriptional regulator
LKTIKANLDCTSYAAAHAKSKGVKPAEVELYELHAVDVSITRARRSIMREQSAAHLGFSVAILHHWERGDRSPSGASLVFLNEIERNPGAVLQALI